MYKDRQRNLKKSPLILYSFRISHRHLFPMIVMIRRISFEAKTLISEAIFPAGRFTRVNFTVIDPLRNLWVLRNANNRSLILVLKATNLNNLNVDYYVFNLRKQIKGNSNNLDIVEDFYLSTATP